MVIIDAGPLVALFDEAEPGHTHCHAVLRKQSHAPLTTWPVLTEAFYLLGGWDRGQSKLWDFVLSGGVRVGEIPEELHSRIHELMKKYSDNPMDVADASLVAIAEHHKIKKIFTLDRRDFSRYRPKHCARFEVIS
ncbi:MAG: PIN domain-containing protein [Nitrospiraceae bacterium]|nr:PIN domain-containing protein [Nitrospiraceae bacterium]